MIIFVMLIGRHRGLPDNIDAAIVIPDRKRFRRTASQAPPGTHATLSLAQLKTYSER